MKQSSIHGMGLFAKTALLKGTELGITHVADKRFADGYIRTPLGAFINHSVTPNCELYDDQDVIRVRTIQDIPEGEELTLDYTSHYTADTLKHYK